MYIINSWAGIGVLIPFAFLFLVGFIVWAGVQKENHARSLKHKEIMNAIDKGGCWNSRICSICNRCWLSCVLQICYKGR